MTKRSLRIVFMGNPEFSVPSLSELVRSQHQILSVITNVDTQQGRGRKLRSTAVADYSERNGIPVLKTESLKSEKTVEYLKSLDPDLFVIVAYKILPKSLLKIPYYGSVNLHGSLLPKYRGAAPIQWALMNGDSSTGLTTFFLKPSIDTGDIALQKKVVIFPDDDFRTLSNRMAVIGALLVRKTVSIIRAGKVMVIPQDNTQATKAPKITPEFCQIDWHRSSIN
ncbi:MAG: methionyl-tRNA formyltransferase, partial [Candidatus Marinimicrobia bacterium]|nr:methionyl-tRNA formyltransferase [Candidatus Neomarinimicrobiota bacterium]